MSLSSQASLGALRLQAQQRADLENSQHVSIPEWNMYISQSASELRDLLIAAYGNEYYISASPYQLTLTGATSYSLPTDFYKLLGVDLRYSGSPTGWITLKRFEFIDRNKFAYPNTQTNYVGITNLRYRVMGNTIQFVPTPSSGQLVQLWYIPEPTPLCFIPTISTTASSTTIGVSDSTDLVVGMTVYCTIPGTMTQAYQSTITAINTTPNQITVAVAPTFTAAVLPAYMWIDSATIDGIAGWEEYVIVDSAIKACIKEEQPIAELVALKEAMKARIEAMAEGRDAGQAHHTSDALSINGYYDGDLGDGDFW